MKRLRISTLLLALSLALAVFAGSAAAGPPIVPADGQAAAQTFMNALQWGQGGVACSMIHADTIVGIEDTLGRPCRIDFNYTPWSIWDHASYNNLQIGYQGAKQAAFDVDRHPDDSIAPFERTGGLEIGKIRRERPELEAYLGSRETMWKRHEGSCVIDKGTTRKKLILWSHSEHKSVWRLTATWNWRELPVILEIVKTDWRPGAARIAVKWRFDSGFPYDETKAQDDPDNILAYDHAVLNARSLDTMDFRHYKQRPGADLKKIDGRWQVIGLSVRYATTHEPEIP